MLLQVLGPIRVAMEFAIQHRLVPQHLPNDTFLGILTARISVPSWRFGKLVSKPESPSRENPFATLLEIFPKGRVIGFPIRAQSNWERKKRVGRHQRTQDN
jgi:hypothetical protein